MTKGDIVTLTIEDISNEGQGIGRAEGLAVFTGGVVWQDVAEVEITKVKKNYAFARLLSIKEPSPYRIEAQCKHAGDCGGCAFQSMSYEGQTLLKEKQVKDKLVRLAKLENPTINPIVAMEEPYMYRNKATMPISTGGIITRKGGVVENLGEPTVGFFKARSHEIVDCEQCMLQAPTVSAVADALRRFMKEDNITAWDPKWEKGLMRHVVVKTAANTGEVMVILVINGKGIPNAQKLIMMMDDAIAELPAAANGVEYSLESVVLNINKGKTNDILSDQCVTLAGRPTIREEMGGLEFEISPLAFYQVNPVQVEKLYGKVLEYADLKGGETVLDIYCGVGTIGLLCAAEMNRLCEGRMQEAVVGLSYNAGQDCTSLSEAGEQEAAAYLAHGNAQEPACEDEAKNATGQLHRQTDTGIETREPGKVIGAQEPACEDEAKNATGLQHRQIDTGIVTREPGKVINAQEPACEDEAKNATGLLHRQIDTGIVTREPGKVIGIESVKGAIIDANRNAVINGIVNASYICGRAEHEIDKLLAGYTDKDGFEVAAARPDVVVLDPPRAGCEASLLAAVAGAEPARIVYVSCDPATLARDIKLLGELGYRFCEATPVDMFPWSGHVETVVLLTK